MKYAYSTDEETYEGSFDTPEAAATEAFSEEGRTSCWVGRRAPPPPPEQFLDVETVIEGLLSDLEFNDEYSGEWADDWYSGNRSQEVELEDELQRVFGAWLDRHNLRPKFFNIDPESITRYELIDGQPRLAEPVRTHDS